MHPVKQIWRKYRNEGESLRAFVRRVVAGHINATLASDERARGIVLTWAASKRLDIVTHGSEAAS